MNIFTNTNYDFMSRRKVWYCISALLIVLAIVGMFTWGGLRFSIDFEGGLILEIKPVADASGAFLTIPQIRDALEQNGISGATLQELTQRQIDEETGVVTTTTSFLIKTKLDSPDSQDMVGSKIIAIVRDQFPEHTNIPDAEFIIRQAEVGPQAGADLRRQAIWAVLIAIGFILIYIWIRFRFAWGFMAAFALFHDVVIALGILSLFDKEIGMTILAALLTIVGYSINNTIVVFDRIRENLKLYRKDDEQVVINRSVNETLSRTILTSFTTLLACTALLIFGGPVIQDFAFTFMVGIIVGTFSSMFISTGLILDTILALKKSKK